MTSKMGGIHIIHCLQNPR